MINLFSGHNHEVTCCCFIKNSNFIVSGSSDNTIRIWNVTTGKEHWAYYCEGGILGLAVDGNDIIVGDSSGQIYYLVLKNISL
jgi:WD40 repeat protein